MFKSLHKVKNFFKLILSAFVFNQNSLTSTLVHGSSYKRELNGHSLVEKSMHLDLQKSFHEIGNGYGESILEAQSQKIDLCIDVGAGTGWLSAVLSDYFKNIISVEPSADAIKLAEQYLKKSAPEFKPLYFNLRAEEFFKNAYFSSSLVIFFQTVLSHLPNNQAQVILQNINKSVPVGSKIIFCEVFGFTHSEKMWYVRNENWWRENLPNWTFNFFGEKLLDREEKKGFSAVKVK